MRVRKAIIATSSVAKSIAFACAKRCRLGAVLLSNVMAGLRQKTVCKSARKLFARDGRCGNTNDQELWARAKMGIARIRGPDLLQRCTM